MIDDRDDLAEPIVRRACERFPELPLLQLAIASQHEKPAAPVLEPVCDCHAFRLRDSHPERAGVRRDNRCRLHVGVAGQSAEPPERVDFFKGQHPKPDQHRVKSGRIVSLRGKIRVGRIVAALHFMQVQPAHDVHRAEAAADVPGAGAGDHVERVDAAKRGEETRARMRRTVHRSQLFKFAEGDVGECVHKWGGQSKNNVIPGAVERGAT